MMQSIPPEIPADTQERGYVCVPSEPVHWGHVAVTVWRGGRPAGFRCVMCGKQSRTGGGAANA